MIESNFSLDNPSEAKSGSVAFDGTNIQAVQRPVTIMMGYNLENSHIVTINNVEEFRDSVYDAVLKCESARIQEHKKILSENSWSEEEKALIDHELKSGKKFHEIKFPPETAKRMLVWGQEQKRFRMKPAFQIVLYRRNGSQRIYIRSPNHNKTGEWFWCGWSEPLKMNFPIIYKCILETEEHCRQIDAAIGIISNNL